MRPGMSAADQQAVLAAMGWQPPAAGAAPPAPGAPAPGGASSPAALAADAQQQTADSAEDQAKIQERLEAQAEAQYQSTGDTLALMKKGLCLEQTWMNTKFKNVLKESSLLALRPALTELLVGMAKLKQSDDFATALSDNASDILGGGVDLKTLLGAGDPDSTTKRKLKDWGVPGFAQGIEAVPRKMVAELHPGERVESAANARRGRGGGKTVTVYINAPGASAWEVNELVKKQHTSA
jgi:hypothetical protein